MRFRPAAFSPLAATVALLALLALLVASPPRAARAQIVVSGPALSPAAGGGTTTFTYNAEYFGVGFGGDLFFSVESGDYFTIYDFDGLVAGTNFQPDGWTFSSAGVGLTPAGRDNFVSDDPAVANLTFTYAGPSIRGGDLGSFGAASTLGGTRPDSYAAQTTFTLLGVAQDDNNEGLTSVPAASAAATPAPPGLVVAGIGGLMGLVSFRRRRRKAAE